MYENSKKAPIYKVCSAIIGKKRVFLAKNAVI